MNKICRLLEKIKTTPLANILLLFGGTAAIFWSVYFSIITLTIPYQIEYREGAALVMADLFLRGENPFTLAHQPLAMNNYGLGYTLITLPFAAWIGNTLLVHRAVTFLFAIFSLLLSVWGMRHMKREVSSALVVGAFVFAALIAQGGIGAFPSAMGTFFFLAAIWIPPLRSFDKKSLTMSAWLALVAFYTKPYFLLAFGVVASYVFLFLSRKKALQYVVFFLTLFLIAFIAVRMAFPLYFIDTFIGNVSNTNRSVEYLFEQLTQLFLYFYPILILSIIMLAAKDFKKKDARSKFDNFRDWDAPLMNGEFNYFLYAFFCAFAAFALVLGWHVGAYLTYFYQLTLPLFLYWLFLKIEFKKTTGVFFAGLVIFNLFWWESFALAPSMLRQKDSSHWQKLYAYLEKTAKILNSPVITSKAVTNGFDVFDSGQTDYFYYVRPYVKNNFIGPAYETFRADGLAYSESINNAIRNREFDFVFTTEGMDNFFDIELLKANYTLEKEIKVDMPQVNQYWPVSIWRPKEK